MTDRRIPLRLKAKLCKNEVRPVLGFKKERGKKSINNRDDYVPKAAESDRA